jgi:hypothetical protein
METCAVCKYGRMIRDEMTTHMYMMLPLSNCSSLLLVIGHAAPGNSRCSRIRGARSSTYAVVCEKMRGRVHAVSKAPLCGDSFLHYAT